MNEKDLRDILIDAGYRTGKELLKDLVRMVGIDAIRQTLAEIEEEDNVSGRNDALRAVRQDGAERPAP